VREDVFCLPLSQEWVRAQWEGGEIGGLHLSGGGARAKERECNAEKTAAQVQIRPKRGTVEKRCGAKKARYGIKGDGTRPPPNFCGGVEEKSVTCRGEAEETGCRRGAPVRRPRVTNYPDRTAGETSMPKKWGTKGSILGKKTAKEN